MCDLLIDLSTLQGFGFVTFARSADADCARHELNGMFVEGRRIEVTITISGFFLLNLNYHLLNTF